MTIQEIITDGGVSPAWHGPVGGAKGFEEFVRATGNQPTAVLSVDQVREIASQPWWGLELPAEFSGDELPSSFERFGSVDSL